MTDDPIAASSVALARIEHLAASTGSVVGAGGVRVRTLAPGLTVETLPSVAMHWRRLFHEGTLVLDGTTVDGLIRCDTFVPGPWLPLLASLASTDGSIDDSALERGGRRDRDDGTGAGRVPNFGARLPPRRAALVDLATVVVARGKRLAADPEVRVGPLGAHSAAVGHVAGLVLLSVHASRGGEVLSATMDRPWPHRLRRTRGYRDPVTLSLLLSTSARVTNEDRLAFHDFCERAD